MQSISELRERYLRLRQVSFKLNNTLVERFSKADIERGAQDLGILRNGTVVFSNEDESAVLFDYCIHNVYRKGKNAVERYMEEAPPAEGSDERLVLEAMSHAWYSIFGMRKVVPGLGVEADDILRRATHLIVDLGLSWSDCAGGMMATRVIPFDGFVMTGGAGLPIGGGAKEKDAFLGALRRGCFEQNITSFEGLSAEQETGFTRTVVRAALAGGAASFIRYEDPKRAGAGQARHRQPALVSGRSRVGRNERCPCGSGKKFKVCCGGNRQGQDFKHIITPSNLP